MMYREYLILFHLLGDCYFAYDLQYDDLPPLLGEMDPYLFQWTARCSTIGGACARESQAAGT